jgi:hypothetical protein
MNASALYARFLCQPLELKLKEVFHLLRRQEGDGDGGGLARRGFDLHGVWVFGVLRFRSHETPLLGRRNVAGDRLKEENSMK